MMHIPTLWKVNLGGRERFVVCDTLDRVVSWANAEIDGQKAASLSPSSNGWDFVDEVRSIERIGACEVLPDATL